MTLTDVLLGTVILVGVGIVCALLLRRRESAGSSEEAGALKAQLAQKTEELGAVRAALETEKKEHGQMQGKNKQLYVEQVGHIEELKLLRKHVAAFEAEEKAAKKDHADAMKMAENARVGYEAEKQRVAREDETERKRLEEERDRLWNEHETNVIARLTDLCKQPQFAFRCFSNTNLPDGFDGSLKPDFMLEFLDQYVIFDAKVSKAKSLQTYISDAVKTTVGKVKKNPKIYPAIFLVVPTEAAAELKSHYYPLDGYALFVVSPDALPAILACYKRIAAYDRIEELDPQQRENIVNVIAELDFHTGLRNAADLLLTKMGTVMQEKVQKLPADLVKEIAVKKQEMKLPNLNTSELKRLAGSVAAQAEAMQELATPKTMMKMDVAKQRVTDG